MQVGESSRTCAFRPARPVRSRPVARLASPVTSIHTRSIAVTVEAIWIGGQHSEPVLVDARAIQIWRRGQDATASAHQSRTLSDFAPNGQHDPRERSAVAVRVLPQLDESATLFARPGEEESPSISTAGHPVQRTACRILQTRAAINAGRLSLFRTLQLAGCAA